MKRQNRFLITVRVATASQGVHNIPDLQANFEWDALGISLKLYNDQCILCILKTLNV